MVSASALSYSGVFAVGLPALAHHFISAMPSSLGLMVAGWGAGQLIGALAASVTGLPNRWGLLIIGMTIVEAVMFTMLGYAPGAWFVTAILFVVGIGVAYSSDAVIGLPRVIFEPVSIALLGLALAYSVQWGFVIAAAPVLVAGVTLALNPQARQLSARRQRPDNNESDAAPALTSGAEHRNGDPVG